MISIFDGYNIRDVQVLFDYCIHILFFLTLVFLLYDSVSSGSVTSDL